MALEVAPSSRRVRIASRAKRRIVDVRYENHVGKRVAAGVQLDGRDVTEELRTEEVSAATSKVAARPRVRQALLARQRDFRRPPGLVADGRDMGSVVFPDAPLKVFLTAGVGTRAERRYKQLMEKGMYAKMSDVVEELRRRDERDSSRPVAPLKHYPDAIFLDTTGLTADAAAQKILGLWREKSQR